MNSILRRTTVTCASVLVVLNLGLCGLVAAQQQLSVEELEAYIAEQKAALEEVRANRDETEQKAQAVRDALAEQDARRERVEQELDTLCKEQEALNPGSYEDCRAQSDS